MLNDAVIGDALCRVVRSVELLELCRVEVRNRFKGYIEVNDLVEGQGRPASRVRLLSRMTMFPTPVWMK